MKNKKKLGKPPYSSKDFSYDASNPNPEHWLTTLFCVIGMFALAGLIIWGCISTESYFENLNKQVYNLKYNLERTQYCVTADWVKSKLDFKDCIDIWSRK